MAIYIFVSFFAGCLHVEHVALDYSLVFFILYMPRICVVYAAVVHALKTHTHTCGARDKHTHTHIQERERIIYAQARATHSYSRSLCHSQRIFMAFQLVHVRFFVVTIRLVRFLSQRRQLSGKRGVASASRGAFIRGALHKILAKSRTRCQQAAGLLRCCCCCCCCW